ncbi:hypothetical protein CROQUDRAFT_36765 [Cronartium quercuum f. sp. fusiforme G11]|uniref:Homeobox domain-containing protein n=1 Tax=Cronartium quercuum f. sp. fusiforme G11 TaxID=708437 RepID=A0A9P6NVW5_9BASI|nr:hypothetical protein CROQUDRAFT_36765 [Cronartium quercuum f. sp. fusiforme G11]
MTPRRVQIWFQNRRQGMKKAQEQRAEQEATTTPTADYGRARGYSFGAYPAPPDSYTPQSHQQPSVYAQGLPAYTSVATAPFESFAGHLYAPRSLARDGMPRQLPQLQLHNNASNSSFSTLNESACSDFAWSEQSASSSTWNGSNASYSNPSAPSVVDRERMFPFGKQLSHPYESSHHHGFPSHGLSSSSRQDQLGNRNRSQTNPDFFQFGDLSHNIHSTPFSHTEAIHQPNPYHSVFRKLEEHATPTQRLVTIESTCSPGRSQLNVRSNADPYPENGLRDQSSGTHGSSVWNEALSRLNLVDPHRSSPFLSKSEKSSPDSSTNFQTPTENLLNQSQNVYPIEYSTPDYNNNNEPSISRNNCGELNNGIGSISPGFKESMATNSHHLHLTESQLIDEVNDLDNPFSFSPGHHRQRSRSYHG